MGADVDTAQSHQGDGDQGEGAAARAETGQGSHAKDDGHTRVPGQVSEAAGVAAATADARKQGHRPGPPHYPLDRFGQRPGASAADQEAGCQLPSPASQAAAADAGMAPNAPSCMTAQAGR